MRVKKLKENLRPPDFKVVTFKDMGTYSEIRYASRPAYPSIQKLDADNYIVLETGEVKQYNHTTTRAENLISVKQSMARLRDIIRTNIQNPSFCRWCCLTYAENMQDPQRLYEDYRRFNQRFQRYLKNQHGTAAEWIATAEPQNRGAFHLHVIYIFSHKAPFIDNKDLARIWGNGYTSIKALKGSDDIALYLSAYLADLPLDEALAKGKRLADIKAEDFKVIGEGEKSKTYIKGGRIGMYPTGMRLYRCSKNVRKPVVSHMTERDAQAHIAAQSASLTYEKTIALYESKEDEESDNQFAVYNYRHYKKGNSREK